MCEEQLGLVTMRHWVPGFTRVTPSSRAKQTEHGEETAVGKLVTGKGSKKGNLTVVLDLSWGWGGGGNNGDPMCPAIMAHGLHISGDPWPQTP